MQSAEVYVHDAVRLVVWRHGGHLAKKVDLAVDNQPLPKPYLGTPLSDAVAAFLAVTDGPAPSDTISLSIRDQAGIPIFRSEQIRIRPLAGLREGLADSDACDRLLTRVLRHAPEKLAGWTDQLTAALAGMRQTVDLPRAVLRGPVAGPTGAVERIEDGKIIGWALDPRRPFRTLSIDVLQDGIKVATIQANRYRPELKTDKGASGHHGFEFEPKVLLADGPQVYEFRHAGSTLHLAGSPCRLAAGELVKEIATDEPPAAQTPERAEPTPVTQSEVISVRGAIDFVDGLRVSGWALDFSNPSKALRLQFEVNGLPAGMALADELREDLESAGAEFHHGFHVLLRKDALASPWRELHRLSVRDLDSGRVVIDGHPIRYRPGQDERELTSFARRIDRLEQTLLELREQVPHLRRRAAFSLDDYDLWFQEVHQPALRREAPRAEESQPEPRLPKIGVIVPLTAECSLTQFQRVLDSLAEQQTQGGHQYLVLDRSQDDQAHKVLARSYRNRIPKLSWIDLRGRVPK